MKNIYLLFFFIAIINSVYSQDSKFGITFSGFVKTDVTYDTRQTVSFREGNFLLYPADVNISIKDIIDKNEKSNFNIFSIQTRLTGNISGPDFFNSKTSGVIEGEFFGTSDGDMNGFRLRHAYLKLDWENTSLLAGQTWNPFFVPECSPGTISFNTGSPFQPFARNPQIRLTQKFGNFSLLAAILTERDFTDDGPLFFSTSYIRNSGIPESHLQFQYRTGKHLFGFGGEIKVIQPQISTEYSYQTDEKVTSFAGIGFCKFVFDKLTLKFEGVYGQNLTDLLMIGGYAVKSFDTLTAKQTYIPFNIFSTWTDISYGEDFEIGLFAGYTKNLGANENTKSRYFGRGYNIDFVYRISPRIKITSGKTSIAAEFEYTTAAYGTNDYFDKAKVSNTRTVSNLRSLISFIYKF